MSRRLALTAELVARCERHVVDPGPEPGYDLFADEDYPALAAEVLARKPPGPLWVFAYGSLIWRPEFLSVEQRRARAHGWHRAFTLELIRWRGSMDQPGMMMALARGGSCDGAAFRIADHEQAEVVERLLFREIGTPQELSGVRYIKLSTPDGPVRALAFWADTRGVDYIVRRPLEDIAAMVARACGHLGSNAAYLHNTIVHLEKLGIHDSGLWRLQQLVADEIIRWSGPPSAP